MARVILFVVSTFKQQQHLLVKRRSRRYPLAGPLLTSNHADGRSVYQAVSWSPLLAAYAVVTLVLCSARGWVPGVSNPLQLLSGCGVCSSSPVHHPPPLSLPLVRLCRAAIFKSSTKHSADAL